MASAIMKMGSADSFNTDGERAYKSGDFIKAIEFFRIALSYFEGMSVREGDFAVQRLDFIPFNDIKSFANRIQANLEQVMEEHPEAVAAVMLKERLDFDTHLKSGNDYYDKGDYRNALKEYRSADFYLHLPFASIFAEGNVLGELSVDTEFQKKKENVRRKVHSSDVIKYFVTPTIIGIIGSAVISALIFHNAGASIIFGIIGGIVGRIIGGKIGGEIVNESSHF